MQEIKVKPWYKMTELGVIPEDWEIKELWELFDITSSKRVFQSEWKNNGVPFYRARELVILGEKWKVNNELFISKEMYNTYKKMYGIPKIWDLLVTWVWTLWKTFLVKNNNEFYFKDWNVIWFKINWKINSDYLNQLYLTKTVQKQIDDWSNGTTVWTYTISWAKKTIIPTPKNIDEQKLIAQTLSDTDELINSLDELIVKKEKIKEWTMQELLTWKRRLPWFNWEWEEKSLWDIWNTYWWLSWKNSSDFENGVFPYITFLNVMNNIEINLKQVWYVNIKQWEVQNQAKKWDLFFNTSSETPEEVWMCAVLNKNVENLYLNSFCFWYRLKKENEIHWTYMSYYINSDLWRKLFYSLWQWATRYNLSKTNFNNIKLKFPHFEEQKAITEVLSDMNNEINELKTKRDKYKEIKDWMMQELLTWKIRLV
jgi:type I restriction enzyme S subunit